MVLSLVFFFIYSADEAVSQLKKGGVGMGSKTVPVKHRDMTRRSSDVGPMKRIPTKATMSRPDVSRSMSNASQQQSSQLRSLTRVTSRQQVKSLNHCRIKNKVFYDSWTLETIILPSFFALCLIFSTMVIELSDSLSVGSCWY